MKALEYKQPESDTMSAHTHNLIASITSQKGDEMISEFESKLVYKSGGLNRAGTYERQTTFKYNNESFSIECNFERMLEFIKLLQNEKHNSYQRIKYTKATK